MVIALLLACADAPGARGSDDSLTVALGGTWTEGARTVALAWPQDVGPFAVSRAIELPEGWSGRAVLHAEATGWRVRVAIDGVEVGDDVGGVRPVEVDLGGRLVGGRHVLKLVIEAPSVDNVAEGKVITGLGAFTGDHPRAGRALAAGSVWLELGAARRIDRVGAKLDGDALVARVATTGAVGDVVRLRVVRDGDVLATLPDAIVGVDGVAGARAPWTGPRWTPAAPELAWLVAELPGGERGQVRFGARDVALDGPRLRVDGELAYLAVQRFTRRTGSTRDALGRFTTLIDAFGANGAELHATGLVSEALDALDELGLYAVVTPICDGRRKAAGPAYPFAVWRAHVDEGHRRLAARFSGHPSLVLWNVEADPTPDLGGAFRASGIPTVDLSVSEGIPDGVRRDDRPLAMWLNELPWQRLEGAVERLDALVGRHRDAGLGLVLPDFAPENGVPLAESPPAQAWAARLRPMLAAHRVAAWPAGERRGVATVEVRVTRGGKPAQGVVVVLYAPEQAPVAAASDTSGFARIDLDYAGPATIAAWGDPASVPVTLSSGRWSTGAWTPSVAKVALAVE